MSADPEVDSHQLIVIGGGTAGLAAARAGVRAGRRTLLVADGPLGGDCTFTGCVPSKTLIESAHQGMGFSDAMANVARVVRRIAATETAEVLRAEGVEVLEGRARFVAPRSLAVGAKRFGARRVVIATGSAPSVPSLLASSGVPYLTNETIFDLSEPPASLIVLGGGPVGCELAQAFAGLGVE